MTYEIKNFTHDLRPHMYRLINTEGARHDSNTKGAYWVFRGTEAECEKVLLKLIRKQVRGTQ